MGTLTVMKKILQVCTVSIALTSCGFQEPVITQADTEPVVITAGKTQAIQKPVTVTTDQTQDVAPEAEAEETAQQDNAARAAVALSQIPYYGNPEICTLSAEQALSYAQLLASGMAGEAAMTAYGDFPVMDRRMVQSHVPWDQPFSVNSISGGYETTRSQAVLADLAGDGNPYLITFDPEKTNSVSEPGHNVCSCTVWGWTEDGLQLVLNSERWSNYVAPFFLADPQTGVVSLVDEDQTGSTYIQRVYVFQDGGTELVDARGQQPDNKTGTPIYSYYKDGVVTQSDPEEWEARGEDFYFSPSIERSYVWPSLNETMDDSLTLTEMMEALNNYADAFDSRPASNTSSPDPAAADAILSSLTYYGDRENCRMSARQALSYAQLLVDGIMGNASMIHNGAIPIMDQNMDDAYAPWDQPFSVSNMDQYETTRSRAILADLAGDGNPYLITFDPEKTISAFDPERNACSCTVWGWTEDGLQLVLNSERWHIFYDAFFSADPQTGAVSISESFGNGSTSYQNTYTFAGGTASLTHAWKVWGASTSGLIEFTEDGVTTGYTEEEWERLRSTLTAAPPNGKVGYTWPTLEETMADGMTLEEMLNGLNDYAVALKDSARPVANPPATEETEETVNQMLLLAN